MTVLVSPIKEISHLHFGKWASGTILKNVDILISEEGRTVIVRDKRGRLLCNRLKSYAYLPGNWPFNEPVLKGLVKLGAITQEAAQQHLDYCAKRDAEREHAYESNRLKDAAEKLGVKLTKAQLKKLFVEKD